MHTAYCPECGEPATIEQLDDPRCVAHATDVLALTARLRELDFSPLPTDPAKRDQAFAEMDAIERRLSELDGHG
jgi:hypothetical protein